MQKQEFEERIERTVTDEQYKVIEEVYIPSSLARSMSSFASSNLLPNTRQRMYHLFSAFFSFFRGVVSRYHMYSIKFSIMAASLLPPCTLYYVPDSHIDVSCHDDLVLFKNHVIRRLQDKISYE